MGTLRLLEPQPQLMGLEHRLRHKATAAERMALLPVLGARDDLRLIALARLERGVRSEGRGARGEGVEVSARRSRSEE